MLFFIIKMQKEELDKYKKDLCSEGLVDDVLWAAEDLLLDETTLENYIKVARSMGTLEEHFSITFFGSPVFYTSCTSDDFVLSCLKQRFDPDKEYEVLKVLSVREDAEAEVKDFLNEKEIIYEVIVL